MERPAPFSFALALLALACGSDPSVSREPHNWPEDAAGPAGTGLGVRVFGGDAVTLSEGRSCTQQTDATGDRWCAFLGRSEAGDENLFVINVSQVIAGAPVACGEADPNCLLLTDSLGGSSADYHPSYFGGDTLVYYDRAFTPYIWRPGMEAGRRLADPDGTRDMAFCTPAERGTAVACLSMPYDQPDDGTILGDLYTGSADGEREPLLAPMASVIAATQADLTSVHRFGFASLADGYVAWSSRETEEGPEVLRLAHVDDPESQITVATDVHHWAIPENLGGWLWIRGANELGIGTLASAGFPDGANESDLFGGVSNFWIGWNGSLVGLTNERAIVAFPDPVGAPGDYSVVDSGIGEIESVSDQGHVAYTKLAADNATSDLISASLDGASSCALATNGIFRSVHFSPEAETVLWAIATDGHYDAYHSRADDCSPVALSSGVVVLGWIGAGHAVFIDSFDETARTGTLRYRKIGKDGELHPDPPTLIAEHATTYATWGPDFLLYTTNAGTDEDGMYLRAFGR